ncbi:MAG: 5-formyltetrahydrofolate cyclo-ligase [Isosphaeraceae bacterium]
MVIRKRRLRRAMRSRIASLRPEHRREQERDLVVRFPDLPGWASAETVMLYVSAFPEEVKTDKFWALAYGAGKRVVCPRVDRAARRLRLYPVEDPQRELRPGVLGIPEPRDDLPEVAPRSIDWVLVPGLAFSQQGYRLGRGAGHYDRLMPLLRSDALCWAVCLSCQLVRRLPIEPHDMPLDGVCTPDRLIRGVRGEFDGTSGPPDILPR